MGIYNLDKIFRPASVAVIGASERPGSLGTALMRNFVQGGFQGRLFPVNPKYRQVMELPAVAAMADLDVRVDLAVVAVPIDRVPDVLSQCAAARVKAAVVISAGGQEAGETGRRVETRISEAAAAGGMRVVGPNCLGVVVPGFNLNASFASRMPSSGSLAFVSQSGAICTAILDLSFKEGIGFSHFVSVGSMLDVDFGDVIDYLGRDPAARSILLYIEQLTNIRKFISAARSVSRIKPIIALKAGSSPAGARAAASHTGALAGEDMVYDAAFKRAGVVRVRTIEELFDCAELLAKQPRPAGARMAMITNGGGPGVMAVDAMAQYGLEPARLSGATVDALNQVLPAHWSHGNPVDVLGDASEERYAQAVDIVLKERNIDALMVMLTPQAFTQPLEVARRLTRMLRERSIPVFAVWMGGRDVAAAVQHLNEEGVATYGTPERAVRAFACLVRHARNLEMLKEIPPRLEHRLQFDRGLARQIVQADRPAVEKTLTGVQSDAILQAYGIPVIPSRVADSADGAAALAAALGWPVVMKILSPDISHKTDADGVLTDLRSDGQVRRAYDRVMEGARRYNPKARIQGVLLQPCIERPDYELLMGVKRDEQFGPAILFGMGGIFTEIIADCALGLPPMNRLLIRRLMEETRVFKLLGGYRHRPPADMTALEMMVLRLSQLVVDIPEIAELDMNPVLVKNGQPMAVDARIVLRPCPHPSPWHLVISPYPAHYELCVTTSDGLRILIRPIQPEDAGLFADLFATLSTTSVYYRFFRYMKQLSPEMLAMLTQIDYDREMALVAMEQSADSGRMLGVARVIADPDGKQAEFSIMIGDPWQGRGVGAQLLLNLLKVAGQRGVERVWGTVLQENIHMQRLGRKVGFEVQFNSEEGTYDLTIDLTRAQLHD
jgi:acetyltransferase